MMSLPWTTRLSVDFFKSLVSISVQHGGQYVCLMVLVMETTISAYVQINHITNADINDSEKSLVLLLELLLIENLYGKYTLLSGFPAQAVSPYRTIFDLSLNPTCQKPRSSMGSMFS